LQIRFSDQVSQISRIATSVKFQCAPILGAFWRTIMSVRNLIDKSVFTGRFNPAKQANLKEYFQSYASIDWEDEDLTTSLILANEIVQVAMEIAWHNGLNAIDVIEGGISYFGTMNLGTEEAEVEIDIKEKS
jgi:hypothetical protein